MADVRIPEASVDAPHTTECIIKRSRFLAQSCHVQGLNAGREFVDRVKKQYPDATHNCWACVGGEAQDSGHAACSDDGEPHGTAGKPMLQVLLYSGISEICVVVTRWFGGVKLGTGGLVRAYQDSVRKNLETLSLVLRTPCVRLGLEIEYAFSDLCLRLMRSFQAKIETQHYGESVAVTLAVPIECAEPFVAAIQDATKGSCVIRYL